MIDFNEQEEKHLKQIMHQETLIRRCFDRYVKSVSEALALHGANTSHLKTININTRAKLNEALEQLHTDVLGVVNDGINKAYELSNAKADALVSNFIKGLAVSDVLKARYSTYPKQVLTNQLQRKIGGLTISDRVWKSIDGCNELMKVYLDSGFAVGRSADKISRDIRQLLNNPDARFRRIRDENGKLVLSQPMKNYHCGTGVYRSAYMNARRLAATNTNETYRLSDCERWKKLDFILGMEVHRSHNHEQCAVCDAMKGKYPKDFVFKGWHPWCICFAVPIMASKEAFEDSLLNNTPLQSTQTIAIPHKAKQFIQSKIAQGKMELDSYMIKGNASYFENSNKK